jgi:DNA anti-recombination protein RmuC
LLKDIEEERKQLDAKLTEEVTRYKAQAEKLVNKINQIRDRKEQEIQNMRETNKVGLHTFIADKDSAIPTIKSNLLI